MANSGFGNLHMFVLFVYVIEVVLLS